MVLRARNPAIDASLAAQMIFRITLLATCLSIFPITGKAADNFGILGAPPKWAVLEKYQETITRDDFARLIQDVYCTHGFAPDLIEINEETGRILMNRQSQKFFTLRFAKNDAARNPVPRLWRTVKSLPSAKLETPLSGLRIALDPGHLGGKWAKMEERWFQVGNSAPVEEGDLTLRVARLLAPRLRKLGAKVFSSGTAPNRLRQNVRTIFGSSREKFLLRTACRIRARMFLI